MKPTASVTAGVRSSLYESLLGKLADEHQALLSELGSARSNTPPRVSELALAHLLSLLRNLHVYTPCNRQETSRFERQVKHQFAEMRRIQQMVSGALCQLCARGSCFASLFIPTIAHMFFIFMIQHRLNISLELDKRHTALRGVLEGADEASVKAKNGGRKRANSNDEANDTSLPYKTAHKTSSQPKKAPAR
jgi:hypothetical protein